MVSLSAAGETIWIGITIAFNEIVVLSQNPSEVAKFPDPAWNVYIATNRGGKERRAQQVSPRTCACVVRSLRWRFDSLSLPVSSTIQPLQVLRFISKLYIYTYTRKDSVVINALGRPQKGPNDFKDNGKLMYPTNLTVDSISCMKFIKILDKFFHCND